MPRVIHLSGFVIALLAFVISQSRAGDPPDIVSTKSEAHDVIVIGGTPAGVAAAMAASRSQKTVILIERSPVLGGVLSSGVIRLDDMYVEPNSGPVAGYGGRSRPW